LRQFREEKFGVSMWCIVTCKGRLEFLRRTAPTIVDRRASGYCLAECSCPQQSGQWLEQCYPEREDVVVERVPDCEVFHKTRANNRGAARARSLGATELVFLDADTLVNDGAFEAIRSLLSPGHFVIAGRTPEDRCVRSLTGFIALSSEDFFKSGGFDETFRDWGAEDIEFRLRLLFELGLVPRELPFGLVEPIAHDDSLRSEFYSEKDIERSRHRNNDQLLRKLQSWSGTGFAGQTGHAARLLFGQH
jgi:hypothetical protein